MRGTSPTRRQKIQMEHVGLNSDNWLVIRDNIEYMRIIHRHTATERIIPKTILEAVKR